jgi:hypothetical protein
MNYLFIIIYFCFFEMSENGQRSTQSTNTNNNNNNSNPTSDTVSSSVPFTHKRWNLVGKDEIFCFF